MQKSLVVLLLVFTGISLSAQDNLDSLYSVWQNEEEPDSVRAVAYNNYIWSGFLFSQPDSAFHLAEILVEFGKERNDARSQGKGHNILGISHALRGNYDQALASFGQCLELAEQTGHKSEIALAVGNIGGIYTEQGNYPQALVYLKRAAKIQEELGNTRGVAIALCNIGTLYQYQGHYANALSYFERGLKLKEEIGEKRQMGLTMSEIGGVYLSLGDSSKALDYFERGLHMEEEIGNTTGIASGLGSIGSVYQLQGNYPKALYYHERCSTLYEQMGNKAGVAKTLDHIGDIYHKQGNYAQALVHNEASLKIQQEIGDQLGVAGSLTDLGAVYNALQKNQLAIEKCQQALTLSEEIGAIILQKGACGCLYNAYKSLGDGNQALVYHEQMLLLDDSLQSEATAKKLQQMEFAKQVLADSIASAEKARVVRAGHEEEVRKKNRTRNYLVGAALFLLLVSGGLYSRWQYVRKAKKVIEKEKDRSENLLLNILPADIAEELKEKGRADARDFDMVSILFTDFKGFTAASEKLSAQELVAEINSCFEAFDAIMGKYNVEKIKTIGDAYMAAGGLPVPAADSVRNTVLAALEMQAFIADRKTVNDAANQPAFEMRVGIHTGAVVAGIVGVKKFAYDIWGDTVNTASRMESSGAVGKVNLSETTYELLKDDPDFAFESRGKVAAKGKGEMEMYFVSET